MSAGSNNIMVAIGIRVPQKQFDAATDILQKYFEAHSDRLFSKIQLVAVSEETYNVLLPLKCVKDEDCRLWTQDFETYLIENGIDCALDFTDLFPAAKSKEFFAGLFLVNALEEEFQVHITDEEAADCKTAGEFV